MRKYKVSVVLEFEADAPNTTEAKGKIMDLKIHECFKSYRKMPKGLRYCRKVTVPKLERLE